MRSQYKFKYIVEYLTTALPTPEEIRSYPLFQNLTPDNIVVIDSIEQCQTVKLALQNAQILGFDTESKPTFVKGEVSTGPHLIQLATSEKAYLFQVNADVLDFLKSILSNPAQIKVGFGLKNDAHLFRKKGIELNSCVDLSKSFSAFGIKNPLGVKNAVAVLFKVHFQKNKKISTSNWSKKNLSSEQIFYAAADAYAPVLIFEKLAELKLLDPSISHKFNLKLEKYNV